MSRLKDEIKPFVKALKPRTLEDAFEYATYGQYKKLKCPSKIAPSHNLVPFKSNQEVVKPIGQKVHFNNTSTRNTLVEQRRALGLSFKCEDKYHPDHQCKIKVQMLLGHEDCEGGVNEVEPKGESVEIETDFRAEEVIVSMHSTSSNPQNITMRFKELIGNTLVCAFVDSGSTYSFVDPAMLQGYKC